MTNLTHTPPLGFNALTPLYDRVIAAMTREKEWRGRLVKHIDARPGEMILDVGSGTGSLAIGLTATTPGCIVRGIDPDEAVVEIARRKAALAGSTATFELGSFGGRPTDGGAVDKVICSLVLHQVPVAEKRRLIQAMSNWLRPGGELFIADYGVQPSLVMRMAFRVTVQLLDGKSDTQPNADGILPSLMQQAGFAEINYLEGINTTTGRIDIIRAEKPDESGPTQ